MAAMPSTHAASTPVSGRCSTARSKSSARPRTLRIRPSDGDAGHGLALLGGAPLEVEELGALALEGGEVVVALLLECLEGRLGALVLASEPADRRHRALRSGLAPCPTPELRRSSGAGSRPRQLDLASSQVALADEALDLGGQLGRRDVDGGGALLRAGGSIHVLEVPAQLYRWSTSSFMSPETKRTVPIASE